jgi:hypothetical protein
MAFDLITVKSIKVISQRQTFLAYLCDKGGVIFAALYPTYSTFVAVFGFKKPVNVHTV